MQKGDLVKCCYVEDYGKIGLILEHDLSLKTIKIYIQDTQAVKTLYSRDAMLYKVSPENKIVLDNSID